MRRDLGSFVAGEDVSFTRYSREIHNPIPDSVKCNEEKIILIFEGLWLMYDQVPWNEISDFYDLTIFMHADSEMRRGNTVTRHIRGNEHSSEDAEKFYQNSDAKNAELILAHIVRHDIDVQL